MSPSDAARKRLLQQSLGDRAPRQPNTNPRAAVRFSSGVQQSELECSPARDIEPPAEPELGPAAMACADVHGQCHQALRAHVTRNWITRPGYSTVPRATASVGGAGLKRDADLECRWPPRMSSGGGSRWSDRSVRRVSASAISITSSAPASAK